jgi:MarR family transcriptional regulator, temperature-dependent positive regulator of motility
MSALVAGCALAGSGELLCKTEPLLRPTRHATCRPSFQLTYHPPRSTLERTQLTMPENDLDYELLRQITDQPTSSQRGLAARLGVSVGKVNYCLRALVDKGWVKANNFRRSDNKLAYAYLLTPRGVTAKVRLAHDFLARKEHEFDRLQREIAALRSELKDKRPNA